MAREQKLLSGKFKEEKGRGEEEEGRRNEEKEINSVIVSCGVPG